MAVELEQALVPTAFWVWSFQLGGFGKRSGSRRDYSVGEIAHQGSQLNCSTATHLSGLRGQIYLGPTQQTTHFTTHSAQRTDPSICICLLLLGLTPLMEQPLRPGILQELIVVDEPLQLGNAATQSPMVAQTASQSRVHPADYRRIWHSIATRCGMCCLPKKKKKKSQ